LKDLFDYWQVHYISQFLPLDEERFSQEEREYCLRLRKNIDQVIHKLWNSIIPILKNLYPNLGDLVAYIEWDEIFDSKIPDILELNRRKTEGVFVYNGEIINEAELKDLQKKDNFEVDFDRKNYEVEEFTGQVACVGKVSGKVRIILKKDEISNFLEGEVLVSYMTMPAFMPAMKKASAFVTDEGGVTCHAAIIAREMNKPCIIGTKIATKALKDGDEVEVDAERGIVRIIKRTSEK
ncbi:MAG: pyruvate, water dikinase, partial [Patescibacteria group bacterium]|nr:pyruvate, water dikinase [Patescibacteria group bacterium]